jgi:hypothetical protein
MFIHTNTYVQGVGKMVDKPFTGPEMKMAIIRYDAFDLCVMVWVQVMVYYLDPVLPCPEQSLQVLFTLVRSQPLFIDGTGRTLSLSLIL